MTSWVLDVIFTSQEGTGRRQGANGEREWERDDWGRGVSKQAGSSHSIFGLEPSSLSLGCRPMNRCYGCENAPHSCCTGESGDVMQFLSRLDCVLNSP